MKKINVALIGYGFSGRVFHMNTLAINEKFNMVKIMTRNKETQKDIKKTYPKVQIITTFQDAVNDPLIDLIVIATPNNVHYEYTKTALMNNKHVVCEKPFLEKTVDAIELFELAESKNLLLRIFHNRKYDGDIITTKELLEQKDFGKIVSFNTRFDRLIPSIGENWRFKKTDMAGIFYDLAPHLVHHCVALFGMPSKVENQLFFDRLDAAVDDHFEMRLTYDSGLACNLGAETLERNPKPRIEIIGTKASYVKYGFDSPDTVDSESSELYQPEGLRSELINNNLEAFKIPIYVGRHYEFYDKVALDINTGNLVDEDKELGLSVVLIMEKAVEAYEKNKAVTIKKIW